MMEDNLWLKECSLWWGKVDGGRLLFYMYMHIFFKDCQESTFHILTEEGFTGEEFCIVEALYCESLYGRN